MKTQLHGIGDLVKRLEAIADACGEQKSKEDKPKDEFLRLKQRVYVLLEQGRNDIHARGRGQRPPRSSLLRLQRHHSAPAYRELSQMGRGQKSWNRNDYDYGGGWEQQQPAYSQWDSKGYGKQKGAGKTQWREPAQAARGPQFPSFDMMVTDGPHKGSRQQDGDAQQSLETTTTAHGFSKNMQKMMNGFRKAETKLRKLEEDKAAVEGKWQKFQLELKQSFLKERSRYYERMGQIKQEASEAQKGKIDALVSLQSLLAHPDEEEQVEQTEMDQEAMEELAELLKEAPKEKQLGDILAETMSKELDDVGRQKMLDAIAEHAAKSGMLRTPTRRTSKAAPLTPTAKDRSEPRASTAKDHDSEDKEPTYGGRCGRDPYITSPSQAELLPSPARASASRQKTPRVAIKSAGRRPTRPVGAKALTQRLEAKRYLAMLKGNLPEAIAESDEEDVILTDLKAPVPVEEQMEEDNLDLGSCTPGNRGFFGQSAMEHSFDGAHDKDLRWAPAKVEEQNRHGPSGGHDRGRLRPLQELDLIELLWYIFLTALAPQQTELWRATMLSIMLAVLASQIMMLVAQCIWSRPFANRQGKGRPPMWAKMMLAMAVVGKTEAVRPDGSWHRVREIGPMTVPVPSDLEIWAAGQQTLREQLADAAGRHWNNMAVENSREFVPEVMVRGVPEADDPLPEHWQWIDENAPRATHISAWLCSPYFAPESVDIAMPFPLDLQRLYDAMLDSTQKMDQEWLDWAMATTPQLHEDFASIMIVPRWLLVSGKFALLIDARPVGGQLFTVYCEGLVSRQWVLRHLDLTRVMEMDVFAFGALHPLGLDDRIQPIQAGYIQILPRGAVVDWASAMETRLEDPARWSPRTDHPARGDKFFDFQTTDGQHLHPVDRTQEFTPMDVACRVFGLNPANTWLRAPTYRIRNLCLLGKRIHSIVAVADQEIFPTPLYRIIILDLRGVGRWPQWVAVHGNEFCPGQYVEDLAVEVLPEFSIVVKGGKKIRGSTNLRVNDGDTLEISLRRTEDITDTESEDEDDDSDPDEDMEEDEEVLRSSDLSIGSPPSGPGPHGPPPPEPVNRQRSRSPRRSPEHTPEESGTTAATLELAKCVPSPSFDLQEDVVELPHEPQDIRQTFHVWPPDWFRDLQLPPKLKKETKKAMSELVHWTKVLRAGMEQDPVEVDLYVDGSYFARTRKSGYAVAVFLRCAGALALFGLFGEGILGNCSSLWTSSSPPALFAEQVALAGALLWIGQSAHFLSTSSYTIYFDCQVAGYGANGLWQGQDEFTMKLRALDRYVQGITGQRISYEHVHSHRGHPWNELVDVVAKAVATTENDIPAPPRDNCAAFLRLDMSWMATIARWGPGEVIPSRAGKWLVIPPKHAPQGSPLDSAQLVPMTSHNRLGRTSRGSTFSTKCATINVQGLRAKSKFLADQFEAGGYRVLFLQETKTTGGLWTPGTYMRFSTDSQKHWGTAIWLHRRLGFLDVNGRALEVDEHDVTIKAKEPRLLILEIVKGGMRCVLFSAHVPHHDKGEERVTFLNALQQKLQAIGKADLIIGGMDGNGRVPCNIHPSTGSLEYGEPDEAGAHLVELLVASNLWIPATFEELHCGPSETFCHANGQYHRIDYVVVGGSSWVSQLRSYTDHDIDLAAARDDHYVTSVDMVGQTWSDAATQKLWRPRYDREKMVTPEGKAILTAALEAYQPPPWWTHVDVHCQQMQEYVCQVLETHFPAPRTTRTSYIPEEVWKWRDQKLALKRRTEQRKFIWARGLAAAFYQWSTGDKGPVEALVRKDGLLYQLAASAIGYATHRIKKEINIGKAKYLRTIVAEGPQSAASILQRAKRHGVGGRKRPPSSRPLPLLLDAKGSPARNQDDHDRIWLQHFGDQEYGKIMEPADFLNLSDAAQKFEEGVVWTAADLPTIGEIECICRTAPTNKAMGLDGIPGEVLRACPVSAASVLEPLFLKAAWGLQQPVQWRGGVIYSAWKQAGEISNPANHRSLFISSVVGKTFHRWLRNKTQRHLQAELHPLHLGSKVRAPIAYASLYVFARFRYCSSNKRSAGMIFLDTTAAYYRVLREAVTGEITYDDTIIWLMKRFNLGPEEMDGLWQLIKNIWAFWLRN
ncbi:hypothetical protein AK812_SmicGene14861 [Symbiodinium microadriaticum]|uniref:RNase H type-1 domain-containing protein n=1 Tax=Symbiodinium microadriaticum TaxID=2951 RepID=A0A1Q9E4E9_SYMMI|nr:hypothetical protein AK812_SmicGene14861 [Symbiodinium microadriaticum]